MNDHKHRGVCFKRRVKRRLVCGMGLVWLLSSAIAQAARPEPTNSWFAGDMHVHRSCGGSPVSVASIANAMVAADLSVVSLLADMGNGEVQNPNTDLPLVNGIQSAASPPGRILQWDAEWHWDATYFQFPHQALGGHLVGLALTNAAQLWSEYTYPVFNWMHQRTAVAGFAHMQYLPNYSFPQTLNCCLPIEYPVEVALGACDFISQDVAGADSAMFAYYRLLNCGFRPGWAGGSDYPCNASIGAVMTFVQVTNGLTYRKWVDGIAAGRTVVSRNGRKEFLNLRVNTNSTPGDTIHLPAGGGPVQVSVTWTAIQSLSGTVQIVHNGDVVASQAASVGADSSNTLTATINFTNSGWVAARRMDSTKGHQVHTAAVFVKVDNAPIRTSVSDAMFYVNWMDELLTRTSVGGVWASYFITNRAEAQARYSAARAVYLQIANEAASQLPPVITSTNLPAAAPGIAYSTTLTAQGGATPYTWILLSGQLPAGLTLNTNSGVISGTPTVVGTNQFSVQLRDAASPAQLATQSLSLAVVPFSATFGLIGNTNTSASSDNLWSSGAYINAGRFQAGSNMTVALMRARVDAITGQYKCAIYTDSGGVPSRLLRTTTAVTNPVTGWHTFPLTAPIALTNAAYYWLAIWSDGSNARIYYSGTNGTQRWGKTNYNYVSWPDPVSTSGGGSLNFSIYASGGSPPAFATTPTNFVIAEHTPLVVTNAATDADGQAVAYSLLNAPDGAMISGSGVITWTPTEAQGPGTNLVKTVATDGLMSATNSFQVVVTEVNQPPVFAEAPTNRVVAELTQLVVTNVATDMDTPAQTVTYSLLNGPDGAVISNVGVVTWTPTETQGPGTNILVTVASDGELSVTNEFTVIVNEVNVAPVLALTPSDVTLKPGGQLLVTNLATDADWPANSLAYGLVSPPAGAAVSSLGVITWIPAAEQSPSTNVFATFVSDGAASVTNNFSVRVLAPLVRPEIVQITVGDEGVTITWSTVPGHAYVLEYSDDCTQDGWHSVLPELLAEDTTLSVTNAYNGAAMRIFRVRSTP